MSEQVVRELQKVMPSPPVDLVAMYVGGNLPRNEKLRINVLPLYKAISANQGIKGLFGDLGLFMLDDANDSNPYCYVTKGPARGCILHLCHDGDTSVEFDSLEAWLQSMRAALEAGEYIDDLSGKLTFFERIDQAELAQYMTRLTTGEGDGEFELPILAKLLDTQHLDVLARMAEHDNFYIREAAAEVIRSRPAVHLLAVAERLATDKHPQVARPAKAGLSVIHRMNAGQ